MGEIRVKVLLTNSVDEALYRRKKLKKSAVRRYEADAMVDTGAVRSIIPAHVMEALGLMSRGNRVAEYADGRTEVVAVTEPIVFAVMGRDTLEEALVLGDEVLIGQTVLENASEKAMRERAVNRPLMVLRFVIVLIYCRRLVSNRSTAYCSSRGPICRKAAALRNRT